MRFYGNDIAHAQYTFFMYGKYHEEQTVLGVRPAFSTTSQVPQQSYCSAPGCQREHRRQWQRLKLQTDLDYQENQARSRVLTRLLDGTSRI
jgi:hypothetical protein